MIQQVGIQGWAVLTTVQVEEPPAPWRRAGSTVLQDECWQRPERIERDDPVGATLNLLVVCGSASVDFVPGSQGMHSPPPPGIWCEHVQLDEQEAVVVDARCWIKVTGSRGPTTLWTLR